MLSVSRERRKFTTLHKGRNALFRTTRAQNMKQQEAEIGYSIGKPYWRQGLVPEGVKAVIARCFNELDLETVWCGHYEGIER